MRDLKDDVTVTHTRGSLWSTSGVDDVARGIQLAHDSSIRYSYRSTVECAGNTILDSRVHLRTGREPNRTSRTCRPLVRDRPFHSRCRYSRVLVRFECVSILVRMYVEKSYTKTRARNESPPHLPAQWWRCRALMTSLERGHKCVSSLEVIRQAALVQVYY